MVNCTVSMNNNRNRKDISYINYPMESTRYLYDVEYGRVVESFRAHDDSVSCLVWLQKERLLLSGGWDCVVRVWGSVGRGGGSAGRAGRAGQSLRGLRAEFDHDGKITSITYRRRQDRHTQDIHIISGTSDGDVYIWSLSRKQLLNKLAVSASALSGVCFVLAGDRVVTASEDGDMNVTDLSVAHSVYQKQLPEAVTSLCWDGSSTLWLGGAGGSLLQWNMVTVNQVSAERVHGDAISSIYLDTATRILVTASTDKTVKLWKLTSVS